MNRILFLALVLSFFAIASLSANEDVRAVQTQLKEGGFYFGEVNGAFSSELSAAMTRYQIRKGLQVTGQLDEETGKALGVKPAVTNTTTTTTTATSTAPEPQAATSSETWRRLRKSDQQFLAQLKAAETRSPAATAAPAQAAAAPAVESSAAPDAEPADPQPAFNPQNRDSATVQGQTTVTTSSSPTDAFDKERLRDYVGAFVLAGLDPQVGAELEFFADQVRYYDEGVVTREKIRRSLESYNDRWPRRRFWIAGNITAQPEADERLRVTFPLRYELQNGSKRSSGKVQKTLLLEAVEDDLQIVAVNETKAP